MISDFPALAGNPHSTAVERDFLDIMNGSRLFAVYQPIVSLTDATTLGFEALSRVRDQSSFSSPVDLFEFAQSRNMLYQLERRAREQAIQGVRLGQADQLLFINISAAILEDPRFVPGQTLELLQKQGLKPHNVVFELTERSSIEDFSQAKRVLEHYRKQGYKIAIDDAGAGYSSLQAIAELHPDFIKVDRSLIQSLHTSKTKEYIVETLVLFAGKMNIQIIAEGIEEREELVKLTRMGVHYGQGYLLGRPQPEPLAIGSELETVILRHRKIRESAATSWRIGDLKTPVQTYDIKDHISDAAGYFKKNMTATGAVVVSGDEPVGLVMREPLFQQLAGQYGFSLFWNRTLDQVMDKQPLIVDEDTPVEQVSQMATSRDINNLYDLVIITSEGKLAGVATIRTILECITNARMENAKVASPLTGLPGNIQIHRELNRRLTERKRFSVIYADLDYFKWYNDRFGFQKGDQLIQFTGDVIQQAVSVCGSPLDFVGHIGGDDFIVMSSAIDPVKLCREMIRRFDQGVKTYYEPEEWGYVEDRSGIRIDSDGVSVSLSIVVCECAVPVAIDEVSRLAASLKKISKARRGSSYVLASCGEEKQSPPSAPSGPAGPDGSA